MTTTPIEHQFRLLERAYHQLRLEHELLLIELGRMDPPPPIQLPVLDEVRQLREEWTLSDLHNALNSWNKFLLYFERIDPRSAGELIIMPPSFIVELRRRYNESRCEGERHSPV